jgi:hypothetical protein
MRLAGSAHLTPGTCVEMRVCANRVLIRWMVAIGSETHEKGQHRSSNVLDGVSCLRHAIVLVLSASALPNTEKREKKYVLRLAMNAAIQVPTRYQVQIRPGPHSWCCKRTAVKVWGWEIYCAATPISQTASPPLPAGESCLSVSRLGRRANRNSSLAAGNLGFLGASKSKIS